MNLEAAYARSTGESGTIYLYSCLWRRILAWIGRIVLAGGLVACGSPKGPAPTTSPLPGRVVSSGDRSTATVPLPAAALDRGKSLWVPVPWSDLPGFADDALFEAWNAWLKSCERPMPPFAAVCAEVRLFSIAEPQEQRAWMRQRLQPYRLETPQGDANGLLTGYFEPLLEARRTAETGFSVPLYQAPAGLAQRKPWYSRQEIDTQSAAQAALRGRAIAYLSNPVDALVLQIQGSGRLRIAQPDGSVRWIRLSYAGSNDQPYRSVGRWLLDQGLVKDASWPGIKAWLDNNPQRQQEMLWINPRVVFFKEELMSEMDVQVGPRGAQGVPLTPGRSIAVDPASIPYGSPVWLASRGAQTQLERLVIAQDTGSAITGAVRADYFTGWGVEAAELAARLRQPLQMWVLWPK